MVKFVETEQTKKDFMIFNGMTKAFLDLIKANQNKGYCGIISMASDAIDCDVSGFHAPYIPFLVLMARLVEQAAAASGKTTPEVLNDIANAVKADEDIDAIDRFFEAEKQNKVER